MSALISNLFALQCKLNTMLSNAGKWVSFLVLRVFIGYEFLDSGLEKFGGSFEKFYKNNWFKNVQDNFPFPFSLFSVDFNWFIATWFEIIGGIALMVGLLTRFFGASLFIVTLIAWAGFHAGEKCGYTFSGCGYKFVVIFFIMLIPLIFSGPGKASLDYFIKSKFCQK